MTTGFLYSQDFLYHNADPKIPHYESSDRLLACLNKLHQTSYFNSLFFPEMKKVPSEFFNEIHSNAHLQKIERSKGKEVTSIPIPLSRKNRGLPPIPPQIPE